MSGKLLPGGAPATGIHETLPAEFRGFTPWPGSPGVYLKEMNK